MTQTTKEQLAEQIFQKYLGDSIAELKGTPAINSKESYYTLFIAAIVEAMDAPAKEDPQDFDLKDNEYLNLNSLSDEAKERFCNDVTFKCSETMLKVFLSLGLKTHIEQMIIEEGSGKEYVLSFRPLDEHLKRFAEVEAISDSPEYDKDVEKRLMSMMEERPERLLMYFLSILGREMVKTNATDLELSQHMDIERKRYKVKAECSIELLHNEQKDERIATQQTMPQGTEAGIKEAAKEAISVPAQQVVEPIASVLKKAYKEWCAETKRSGGVIIGKSIYEFFNWFERYIAAQPLQPSLEEKRCPQCRYRDVRRKGTTYECAQCGSIWEEDQP